MLCSATRTFSHFRLIHSRNFVNKTISLNANKIDIHEAPPKTQITKLDNGIRVATLERNYHMAGGVGMTVALDNEYSLYSKFLPFSGLTSGKKYSASEITSFFSNNGLERAIYPFPGFTSFEIFGTKNNILKSLDVMIDSLFNINLDEINFDEAKAIIEHKMQEDLDTPTSWPQEVSLFLTIWTWKNLIKQLK